MGIIFDLRRFAIHDGPGIRTTVFFKGCPLQCLWCHNPESWLGEPEHSLRGSRCVFCRRCAEACPAAAISSGEDRPQTDPSRCLFCGGCVDACPTGAREILGRRVTVAELIAQFERDVIFYDQSGGGITCSGGEPLAQPAFLAAVLKECQAREIRTAVDTSCYASWDVVESVGRYTDLFLVDLKHMDRAMHERLTGVSNEPILRNLQGLVQWKKELVVRLPIIPGLTDGDANVRATAEFLSSLGGVRRIDILPHNEASRGKTARLAAQRKVFEAEAPSAERMRQIAERLEAYGFFVTIGG